MGRKYRIERFVEVVRKFREAFRYGMLSTDVIVGFPFETVSGLKMTADVIREVEPEILNITKYSPRPGTAAFNWKTPPTNQTAQWSQIFSEIHRDISRRSLRRFVGTDALITLLETGKNGTLVGRDQFYHPVVVRNGTLGESRKVRIVDSSGFYLIAK